MNAFLGLLFLFSLPLGYFQLKDSMKADIKPIFKADDCFRFDFKYEHKVIRAYPKQKLYLEAQIKKLGETYYAYGFETRKFETDEYFKLVKINCPDKLLVLHGEGEVLKRMLKYYDAKERSSDD